MGSMDKDFKKFANNLDYDLAYEKLFEPLFYEDDFNYTVGKGFAISNEKLSDVFKDIDLTNKSVLTVGSSGDQAINSILKGAKDITIADINVFTEPFVEYKLALIRVFDFETFNDLFVKPRMFNYKVYRKISHLLSPTAQQFWDSIMLDLEADADVWYEFNEKEVAKKMLIIDHSTRYSDFYKKTDVYLKLQNILRSGKISIKYVNAELEDFSNVIKGKFDLIYLSNIYYYYKESKSDKFEKIVKDLYDKRLNKNGTILVNYDFCYGKDKAPKTVIDKMVQTKEVKRWDQGESITDTVWLINKKDDKCNEVDITK